MRQKQINNLKPYWVRVNRWVAEACDKALQEAYEAALNIEKIEKEHFNGEKISTNSVNYSSSIIAYFQADLNKNLTTARLKLSAFKVLMRSRVKSPVTTSKTQIEIPNNRQDWIDVEVTEKSSGMLEKLTFIDKVLAKYNQPNNEPISPQIPDLSVPRTPPPVTPPTYEPPIIKVKSSPTSRLSSPKSVKMSSEKPLADQSSFLPRSILTTLYRIKRDLDPKSEQEVVQEFRQAKNKTIISLRIILLMIVVPVLTHQISKTFIVGPIVEHFREPNQVEVFLNQTMEEEAFKELQHFEEKLKFKILIGEAPSLSAEEIEEKVKHQAEEIALEFREESSNAIKNVFADILSLIAFAVLILVSQDQINTLKSFLDQIVYGLSDSAKAFIIILFTDIFVGFHSPHGWEVILDGMCRHLGLPENRDFNFLFIATFPVMLDTIFKYWIFRYLNRISPSAVATLREMDE